MRGRSSAFAALGATLALGAMPLAGCSEESPEGGDLASPARTEASPAEREELREPREERREERDEHTDAPYAPTE